MKSSGQDINSSSSKSSKSKRAAAAVMSAAAPIVADTPFEWGLSLGGHATATSTAAAAGGGDDDDDGSDSSSDDDDDGGGGGSDSEKEEDDRQNDARRKRQRRDAGAVPSVAAAAAAVEEEQLVRQRETELASGRALPQRDDDYERLLVGSPSNSFLWIQYMAFKLSMMDVDGARRVGERALRAVPPQEEQDVFNVYAALMNLESKYGNEHTQKRVFERARTYCEPKQVYLQQAKVYELGGDADMAEEVHRQATRRYRTSRKVWEAFQLFELRRGRQKEASALLERSLVSLPERKHLKAISKFAVLQYKHGSIVQGNKLFEGIVSSYPNRTDMWSMFIDMETSARRYEHVRQIFERVVHVNMSTLRMKNFLQRYLRFEQDHGTEEGQEHVKKIAREYIAMKKQS